jgi:hypothetical protein
MLRSIPLQDLPASVKSIHYFNENNEIVEIPVEARPVKLLKTEAELREHRRLYRKEYMKRPHVQEKIQKRLNDPEALKKRIEYANREDVKKRKQALATRTRAVNRLLKQKNPELYSELVTVVESSSDKVV